LFGGFYFFVGDGGCSVVVVWSRVGLLLGLHWRGNLNILVKT
jgi:hypothetical protein